MSNLLVVIADFTVEPLWKRVQSVLHKHLPVLGHVLVYTDQVSPGNPRIKIILLCGTSISDLNLPSTSPSVSQDLADMMASTPEFRLYKPLGQPLGISTLSAVQAGDVLPDHILVSVSLVPTPSSDETFNNWYKDEHIPLLKKVPTWIASERFLLDCSTGEGVPRYLALHKWGGQEAFATEEYKAATNTPWRTVVMGEIIKKERFVLKYAGSLANLARENAGLS